MKKRLYRWGIAGILILGTVACSESFLDADVQNKFTISNYYKTTDEIKAGVTLCYNALWTQSFHVGKFIIGNILADDATKGGENDTEWPEINAAAEFRITPYENIAEMMWEPCYRGITRANFMIDIINNREITEEEPTGYPLKERLLGECKFIRAFFSYYLTTLFGNVPYFIRPTNNNITDDLYQSVDRTIIWQQIEEDLIYAAAHLPKQTEYPEDDWGRITQGAAQAMLGKTYLFQHKYDKAASLLLDLIENGGYSLLDNYGQVFWKEVTFSSESIFEIPFGNTQFAYVSQEDGAVGTGVLQFQARRDGDDGWGYNNPTQDLVNEFEAGDPRLIYTVIFPKDQFEPGKDQSHSIPKYGYFNRKAYLLKEERLPNYGNVDYHLRIIRLSDVYLMYAEAATLATSEKNTDKALYYLNEVRRRANRTPKVDPKRVFQYKTIATVSLPMREYLSDAQLLRDIQHERRVELGMEDYRWWDLVRWNDRETMPAYYQRWGNKRTPNNTYDDKGKFFIEWAQRFPAEIYPTFPIPQNRIQDSDNKIQQSIYYNH